MSHRKVPLWSPGPHVIILMFLNLDNKCVCCCCLFIKVYFHLFLSCNISHINRAFKNIATNIPLFHQYPLSYVPRFIFNSRINKKQDHSASLCKFIFISHPIQYMSPICINLTSSSIYDRVLPYSRVVSLYPPLLD